MFSDMLRSEEDSRNRTKYIKYLGWNEFDEDGDKEKAVILVIDVHVGYNVYRMGGKTELLHWSPKLSDAVEWAVDCGREVIKEHDKTDK